MSSMHALAPTSARALMAGFWLLGLCNNIIYVITNAGAKELSPGSTGLVYLANILPTFLVKLGGPYVYHLISYPTRVAMCVTMMVVALLVVAIGDVLAVRLFGLGVGALASGLGESSFLALASRAPGGHQRRTVTAWSSGTGFAGVGGYLFYVMLTRWMGMSFRVALLIGCAFPALFAIAFWRLVRPNLAIDAANRQRGIEESMPVLSHRLEEARDMASDTEGDAGVADETDPPPTARQRAHVFLGLWPFTVPLFLVYLAEYILQSGVWSAIGFPVESKSSRDAFYVDANWAYQFGVFLSRSSGSLCKLSVRALWLLPAMQLCMLVFFIVDSVTHVWWNNSLLLPAFVVGLLGGSCYVHGFSLIGESVRAPYAEFALASSSVCDTLGIMVAGVISVFVQGCLYGANGGLLDDSKPPEFQCGYNFSV